MNKKEKVDFYYTFVKFIRDGEEVWKYWFYEGDIIAIKKLTKDEAFGIQNWNKRKKVSGRAR